MTEEQIKETKGNTPVIKGHVSKECDVFRLPGRTEHWYPIGKDGGDRERYWVVTYFHRPNSEQEVMMDNIRLASKKPDNRMIAALRSKRQQPGSTSRTVKKAA